MCLNVARDLEDFRRTVVCILAVKIKGIDLRVEQREARKKLLEATRPHEIDDGG